MRPRPALDPLAILAAGGAGVDCPYLVDIQTEALARSHRLREMLDWLRDWQMPHRTGAIGRDAGRLLRFAFLEAPHAHAFQIQFGGRMTVIGQDGRRTPAPSSRRPIAVGQTVRPGEREESAARVQLRRRMLDKTA